MIFLSTLIGILLLVKFVTGETVLIGEKWNENSKIFEPIAGLSTYAEMRRKIILETRKQESHNFNGEPLKLTYYEDLGFVQYYDNDTKISGICGDMWTILSKYLNFTLVLRKNEEHTVGVTLNNGSYSGILELVRVNDTDILPKTFVYYTRLRALEYGPVMWMNSQRIFAHGHWKRNRAWIFQQLTKTSWAYLLGFVVMLSVASFVTQRILILKAGRNMEYDGYIDHLFHIYSTLCNQGTLSDRIGSGSRFLNLTIAIFAFLTLVAYNAGLIHSMTVETFEAPFNDLETLMNNTKFHVVVLNGSTSHVTLTSDYSSLIYRRIKNARRYAVASNVNELYAKVCRQPDKYVMMDSVDEVAVRGEGECSVIPVGIPYSVRPIAAGISRSVKSRKTLYRGIMKLREYGVLDVLKKRYMRPNEEQRIRRSNSLTIDMDRVSIIFCILYVGVFASIIICVVENIIFISKKRKFLRYLSKKVFGIGRSMRASSLLKFHRRDKH